MSVDIHPTSHLNDTAVPEAPKSRPVAGIIAGSLVAGAVNALVLTLQAPSTDRRTYRNEDPT